jgi:hypothetical protein
MSFHVIDLIKNIPPAARRVLEVSDSETGIGEIFAGRAPMASVTSVRPGDTPTGQAFDCIALFAAGMESDKLAGLFERLPPGGQILAAPDAIGADLVTALRQTGCHVFEQEPVLRSWRSPDPPARIALHCMITPEQADDAHIRVHQPNGFLRTVPGMRPMTEIERFSPSLSAGVDAKILLMHRAIPKLDRDVEFLKAAMASGYLIVLDLDDDPGFFKDHFRDDAFALRCLHAAQVSTPEIADRLRHLVPEIAIFPNHLAMLPARPIKTEATTRIFIGAYNRGDDWAEIGEQANRVLGHFGDRVEVEVVHDRSIFNSLRIPNKRFTPRCPYQDYLKLLGSCHIAMLPLRNTAFNRCKSDLKFIECAAHGVAVLAPLTVYAASLDDGKTGILYRSPAEFMVGLQRLIQEVDLREWVAAGAREYVANSRMLADHYEARHTWYQNLVRDADSLRAAHRVRAPELYD